MADTAVLIGVAVVGSALLLLPAELLADLSRTLRGALYASVRNGAHAVAGKYQSSIRRTDTLRQFARRPPRAARVAATFHRRQPLC